MAIDLKKMQAKLDALQNKGRGGDKKSIYWTPKEAQGYNIRIVNTPDGDPLKEFWFHYDLGVTGFLCPKKNFGETCPACEFANKLFKEKTEDSTKLAKTFLPRVRYYSPVVVRGEEADGVKAWGYGKTVYQDILSLMLNPDYGDITDPDSGTDLSLMSKKIPGASFPTTKLTPARKTSKLCQGSATECSALLSTIPDLEAIHTRKTSQEVGKILEEHLNSSASDEDAEGASTETVKFAGSAKAPVDDIDSAFADLLS